MSNNISNIIRITLDKGFQIEPNAFNLIKEYNSKDKIEFINLIEKIIENKINDRSEKIIKVDDIKKIFLPFEDFNKESINLIDYKKEKYQIIINLNDKILLNQKKFGFNLLFNSRYEKLLNIIKERPDYNKIELISNLNKYKQNTTIKITGLILKKKVSRNSITISIDDKTGLIDCIVFEKSIINKVKEILLDSFVICDILLSKNGLPVIKNINLPDVPMLIKKLSKNKVYAIFTSDIHVGSKNFLEKSFNLFIEWLNSSKEDKKIVEKIMYLVIAGDIIDGIGVYPGQEIDLLEQDVRKQINKFTDLIKKIPKRIEIFIIPGNHDPVRQAIPQPSIPLEYANELYSLNNVNMLSNPSFIRLSEVDVLVYHGRSLDDVIATTPGYSFTRPSIAMKNLIKSRHLVPIYGERTSLAPSNIDNLVIENIPKIFHTGHIHTLDSEFYKGILLLNSGSWQSQTPYQAKMGIIPTPAIVPIVDLSTLDIITKDFKIGM